MESIHANDVTLTRRGSLALLGIVLFALGVVLCQWNYGDEFWGNWLHSGTFHVGWLAISMAISLWIGLAFSKALAGMICLAACLIANVALFWNYLGWLILFNALEPLFEPHR